MQMSQKTFKEAFTGNRRFMLDKLDVGRYLLASLHDHGLLNDEQLKRVEVAVPNSARSELLLEELLKADDNKLPVFIDDLIANGQPHVANLILSPNTDESESANQRQVAVAAGGANNYTRGHEEQIITGSRVAAVSATEEHRLKSFEQSIEAIGKEYTKAVVKVAKEELTGNQSELLQTIEELERRNAISAEEHTLQCAENQNLKGKVSELEQESTDYQTKLQSEVERANELRDEVVNKQRQLDGKNTEVQLCESKLQNEINQVKKLKQELEETRKQYGILNTHISAGQAYVAEHVFMWRVMGITLCDNIVIVLCTMPPSLLLIPFSPLRFLLFSVFKYRQLGTWPTDHFTKEGDATDIVSMSYAAAGCGPLTNYLLVAGKPRGSDCHCVWRMLLDGSQFTKLFPTDSATLPAYMPYTLSVTSKSNKLLVTSKDSNELLLYAVDETGATQLKRISLSSAHISDLQHAVETSSGTFIVSGRQPKPKICEINAEGHVIKGHVYCDPQRLSWPIYLSLDSDDRIFVADRDKHRILLLSSFNGPGERVVLDTEQNLTRPRRLFYTEQTIGDTEEIQQIRRNLVVGGGRLLLPEYAQLYSVEHNLSK